MTDESQGQVLLFPENFPDWALTDAERRAKRRLRLVEREDSGEESENETD